MNQAKFFTVTETCRKLDVESHVLRYWEKEFELSVKRNSAGRRIYSSEQLERLRLIKHLVRDQKLTIQGARKQLARMRPAADKVDDRKGYHQTLLWLKKELLGIRDLLAAGD